MYVLDDTFICMKTTVEITDSLLSHVRLLAVQEGTSVRALIEEGLRKVVSDRSRAGAFRLRDVSVGGHGLQSEFQSASFAQILDAAADLPS